MLGLMGSLPSSVHVNVCAQGAPSLRHLTLSHRINNLWNTGRWTEEGLAAYKRAAPGVELRFISS